MIGYAFCGSFCTISRSLSAMQELLDDGYDVLPIMSETVYTQDTRFHRAAELQARIRELCQRDIIHTVVDAEPLGPSISLDALIISPCTGNTLAKMAHGITDGAVTMAAKAHMRCDRPLLIALASNDGLSANMKNISTMLMRKNVYFLPLRQDDVRNKPHSLVCEFEKMRECLDLALQSGQSRPLFL